MSDTARSTPTSMAAVSAPSTTGTMPRLEQRRPAPMADDGDDIVTPTESVQWGVDEDGPPPEVKLAANLPAEALEDDFDPLTHSLLEQPSAPLGEDVANVVGVRFVPGGRVQWFDSGEGDYAVGERVIVDSDRGQRLGWIGVAPTRRAMRDSRGLRRVVRRASDHDLRGEREGEADLAKALRVAKDKAAALRLPLKVFRVELSGPLGRGMGSRTKANVYYTSDERIDMRDFIRDLGTALGARIELRQLGVRDEAKAVGGIGSCGLTLCCTTWLPDFVPVSIKMAKDQGLVLSPTKVSGQCGRLKCCLVYEQAAYAELRKGLPKLGKRVFAPRGEGRVVEVDVLRQRVRVSYGPGDTEVLPAADVKPMFPSGNPPPGHGGMSPRDPRAPRSERRDAASPGALRDPTRGENLPGGTVNAGPPVLRELAHDAEEAEEDITDPLEATDDPSALAHANIQPSFVGGAPSPLDVEEEDGGEHALSEGVAEANDGIDEALRDVPDDEPFEPS